MSIASVLGGRLWRWREEIVAYGYDFMEMEGPPASWNELRLRARRPDTYGGPQAVVGIREVWATGLDPDHLGLEEQGCYLVVSEWHAQIGAGDRGALRLDVDRRKPDALIVHLHPFGRANDEREPAHPLASPESWMEEVETIIASLDPAF